MKKASGKMKLFLEINLDEFRTKKNEGEKIIKNNINGIENDNNNNNNDNHVANADTRTVIREKPSD